jgi:hypothetical protein
MGHQHIARFVQRARISQIDALGFAADARNRGAGGRGNQSDQGIEGVGHRRAILKGASAKT